jgi:hypothetical protein
MALMLQIQSEKWRSQMSKKQFITRKTPIDSRARAMFALQLNTGADGAKMRTQPTANIKRACDDPNNILIALVYSVLAESERLLVFIALGLCSSMTRKISNIVSEIESASWSWIQQLFNLALGINKKRNRPSACRALFALVITQSLCRRTKHTHTPHVVETFFICPLQRAHSFSQC